MKRHWTAIAGPLFALLLSALPLWGQQPDFSAASWDTLGAEILIINEAAVPDSAKAGLFSRVLARFHHTADQYQAFRGWLFEQPAQVQADYVKRVKAITENRLKELRPRGPGYVPPQGEER